ncbi:MAG: retropepsin-like aspartic protease [Chitinispirillaceae bacterium]|jgi:clan AA aspartic protease (TIGR02281 family)
MNFTLFSISTKSAITGIVVFIIVFVFSAHGDIIRLKSGGSITGVITAVKNGAVTINVGFGLTRVDSSDIKSVTRSSAGDNERMQKEWRDLYYADSRSSASPGINLLREKLRRLRALRIQALNRQHDLELIDFEIDSLEHAVTDNASGYHALDSNLNNLSKKEPEEQYRLVGKAHQYNSAIISLQQVIERKKTDQQNGNPALAEYMDSLAQMDESFYAFKRSCAPKTLKENRPALNSIENDLQQCQAEFKTATADATFIRGDNIIVPVTINGRGPVRLLLDTGASTVTLSRALAARLGINWRDGVKVTATLADGQSTAGYSVLLRSVAIGDFRAANVRAVVLDQPPEPGVDGLLGMSYLQRFVLRIDAANKKFVMKKIIAK